MQDTQKRGSYKSVNAVLRVLTVVYFILRFFVVRFGNPDFLLIMIPIMIIAARKRKDTTNLLLSIMVSAGLLFDFIARHCLPHSFLYEKNGDLTLFGQMNIVIWVLSLYTGVFLLAFRDLVIASKENDENGRKLRIIGYILLGLCIIPVTMSLGFILWMAVTNYYP